ncbi:MAG: hypothetical protein AAFO79_04520 [Pseudomonadota bacterium]
MEYITGHLLFLAEHLALYLGIMFIVGILVGWFSWTPRASEDVDI